MKYLQEYLQEYYRKLFNITYNAKKVKILLIARINVKQDIAN